MKLSKLLLITILLMSFSSLFYGNEKSNLVNNYSFHFLINSNDSLNISIDKPGIEKYSMQYSKRAKRGIVFIGLGIGILSFSNLTIGLGCLLIFYPYYSSSLDATGLGIIGILGWLAGGFLFLAGSILLIIGLGTMGYEAYLNKKSKKEKVNLDINFDNNKMNFCLKVAL